MSKPSVPDVLDRFVAYKKLNPVWGSLHIILDDGNFQDSSVQWCIEYAQERADSEGAELARILATMSRTQRRKIAILANAKSHWSVLANARTP